MRCLESAKDKIRADLYSLPGGDGDAAGIEDDDGDDEDDDEGAAEVDEERIRQSLQRERHANNKNTVSTGRVEYERVFVPSRAPPALADAAARARAIAAEVPAVDTSN